MPFKDQSRKILKGSACERKTIEDSIHVFTQEGNQCGLSLLVFLNFLFFTASTS